MLANKTVATTAAASRSYGYGRAGGSPPSLETGRFKSGRPIGSPLQRFTRCPLWRARFDALEEGFTPRHKRRHRGRGRENASACGGRSGIRPYASQTPSHARGSAGFRCRAPSGRRPAGWAMSSRRSCRGRIMRVLRDAVLHGLGWIDDGVVDIVGVQEVARHGIRRFFDAASVVGEGVAAHDAVGIVIVGVARAAVAAQITRAKWFRQVLSNLVVNRDGVDIGVDKQIVPRSAILVWRGV